jgi:hypothetical protein
MASTPLDQFATTFLVQVFLDDGKTPATGLTSGSFTNKKRSKNGAAFGNFDSFAIAELAYGHYVITCATTDTDTTGPLMVHLDGTGLDNCDKELHVRGSLVARTGTAAGGAAGSITLDAGASATNNFYAYATVFIVGGTGAGQARTITSYNGGTKVATIGVAWVTNPDATSVFIIMPQATADNDVNAINYYAQIPTISSYVQTTHDAIVVRVATLQAGSTASTVKLDAGASATDDLYDGLLCVLTGGTGAGQARLITAYNGTSKVAQLLTNWTVTPDNTTTFELVAWAGKELAEVPLNVWEYDPSGSTSGSAGDKLQNMVTNIWEALLGDYSGTANSVAAAIDGIYGGVAALGAIFVIRSNTAQNGGTSSTIKLDAAASAVDNYYRDAVVTITSGTGAGQSRVISSYVGATKVATVSRDWITTPDNSSHFYVIAIPSNATQVQALLPTAAGIADQVWEEQLGDHSGTSGSTAASVDFIYGAVNALGAALLLRSATCQAGSTGTTLKLDAGASATNDLYKDLVAVIVSGTGAGQARRVIAYAGATKVATVDRAWATTPDGTSAFRLMPFVQGFDEGMAYPVAAAVWNASIDDVGINSGSYGFLASLIYGLSNGMTVIDNTTHTADGLTAARLRVFTSDTAVAAATDGGSGEGEIAIFDVTCSYDAPGKINLYKARRTS